MRLVKVGVHGYRRFHEKSEMNVDEEVIAILGPNEAGKSSLLQALSRLSDSEPFTTVGGQRELTRDSSPSDDERIVWALFELGEPERRAVAHLPGSRDLHWYTLFKRADGELRVELSPPLRRSLEPRRKAAKALARLLTNPRLRAIDQDPTGDLDLSPIRDLVPLLQLERETLPDEVIEAIGEAAELIAGSRAEADPRYILELPKQLEDLAAVESDTRPHSKAVDILDAFEPRFVLFGEEDRVLLPEYDLEATGDDPANLRRLASMAQLDLARLRRAIAEQDQGGIESLLVSANETLSLTTSTAWRQSDIEVHMRVDGSSLHVQVSQASGYVSIAERSDGMRWFVALLMYLMTDEDNVPPIVLVDEAETHLHYDAQADMVRVFSRQSAAAKIIYTTHSAGCLPEDLGTGVRIIAPRSDGSSHIRNEFWQGTAGFSPLLMAMGASVLAFTPTRRAVIAEGPSETLLLPSLLREATGLGVLGFQVAPGLAQIPSSELRALELEAARVVYLVDSDKGGDLIRRQLLRGGIPNERILELRAGRERGLVIEDFVDERTFLSSVKAELNRSGHTADMPRASLPKKGRAAAVQAWCKRQGIPAPHKRAIAQQILSMRHDAQLVASSRRQALVHLYEAIAARLDL